MIAYIGQLLIGLVFVIAAVFDYKGRNELLGLMTSKNIPYREYLLPGAIGLKLVCGLALILNILAPLAAFFLAGFTIIANYLFNNFWQCEGKAREAAFFKFLTHSAIIGGLLVILGQN
jgi:uncharacterized membrane protein YphA (DoxX/SURF4 family)